jgi:hypothetical protein
MGPGLLADRAVQVLTPFLGVKYSTRTGAVLSAQAWTVRGQEPDGLRPGAGLRFPV